MTAAPGINTDLTGLGSVVPGASILIVDDEPENRRLLELLLRPEGYRTQSVSSGEEALASIATQAPDLILLDVMMPGMDGFDVARRLKADPVTSRIPIIIVTSHSDRDARLTGLEAGADEFLSKPIDRAELWLRVRALLRLKQFADYLQDHGRTLEQEVQAGTREVQRVEQLRYSQAVRQALVLDSLPAHIAMVDAQGCIVAVNRSWRRFADENGFRAPDFGVGLNYLDVCDRAMGLDALEAPSTAAGIRSVLSGEAAVFSLEYPCHSPTERRWFLLTVTALREGSEPGAVLMHLDITERLVADAKLLRQTQLYAALSQCNEAIVRSSSEDELFAQVCRIAVQFGGMRMAWVGLLDAETRLVRPAASFGTGTDELGDIEVSSMAGDAFDGGQVDAAAREGRAVWIDDFGNGPASLPWRERGARHGWAGTAALPLRRNGAVAGVFVLYAGEINAFDAAARRLLIELSSDINFALDNFSREARRQAAEQALRMAFMSTVEVTTILSELRDPYTAGHERRVGALAAALGAKLGLDADRQEGLKVAGSLHDVGKISIPSEILSKPGRLSPIELLLVREHAEVGYNVLKGVSFPWPVAQVARQHHERIDGSGYPLGLKGDEILLEARIMAVADVVEAMSSHRPYRAMLGIDRALAEIRRGRSTAYDPLVADACLRLFQEDGYQLPV